MANPKFAQSFAQAIINQGATQWERDAIARQALPVEELEFTRVNSDVNGNPRYVVHFLNLNTRAEVDNNGDISGAYAIAIKRANSIGGRKFHNKQYGGGIVFQSYSIDDTANHIGRVTGRNFKATR